MYEIMKDIPLPPGKKERLPPIPIDVMNVGECLDVPKVRRSTLTATIIRHRDAVAAQGRGVKVFTTRVEGDKIRVWRVA